jgi:hypothetical protein
MKKTSLTLATVLALALCATSSLAQEKTDPTPIPLDPSTVDFTGTWNYSTSNHKVSGDCPNGSPMDGTLAITQTGNEVGLMVTSGAVCNPASMCMYSGGIDDEYLLVSNTDTVDDEGGSATNALRLHFYSSSEGRGESSSSYVHPKGFECQWGHQILVWRSEN